MSALNPELIMNILTFTASAYEILVVIFLVSEFVKPKSPLHSGFFYLHSITLAVDATDTVAWFVGGQTAFDDSLFITPVISVETWYAQYGIGFWNAAVAFTQCSALAFPFFHQRLYSGHTLKGVIFVFVLFPFIVNGHSWLNLHCRLYVFNEECAQFNTHYSFQSTVLNSSMALLGLVFVLVGVARSAGSASSKSSARTKVERRLMLQTAFSCFFLCAFSVAYTLAMHENSGGGGNSVLKMVGNVLYLLQHYPSMVVLVVASPAFRNGLLRFYSGGRCIDGKFRVNRSESRRRRNTVVFATV